MIYKRNLELLKKRYEDIYNKVTQFNSITPDTYDVVMSKGNSPTIKINIDNDEFYLHSKYDPIKEAKRFIDENYEEGLNCYIIYGFGLGYHIRELVKKEKEPTIYVFEANLHIFNQALLSVDLEDIFSYGKLEIVLEDDITRFASKLKDVLSSNNSKLVIHQPSLRTIPKEFLDIRYSLEDYRAHENTANYFKSFMEYNFNKNIQKSMKNVDCLFDKFIDKTIFIISAGPSLSKNISELKRAKNKGLILAVGTAVKPLLRNGIYPDLIIITDPQDIVVNQIEGIEIDVPIIILATCNYKIAEAYKGPKILALQNGFNMSEEYAKKNGNQLVKTGGSVTTTALDVAIKLGCSTIVFVGQDLAYTNGKTHTEGTLFYKEVKDFTRLRVVEGIDNTTVHTSVNLYIYKKWIEKRIQEEKNIQFINATEGGALIKGAINMTLKNVIDTKVIDTEPCKYQGIINNILIDKSH